MIDAMAPMNTVPKGRIIVSPSSNEKTLYLLKNGRVRLYKMNEEGKQLTIGILGKGNVFGETDTFSTGSHHAFVEAIDDVLLCALSKHDLEQIFTKRPEVAMKMISILTERMQETQNMLENLAFRDVRYRILYLLAKLAKSFGDPLRGEKGFTTIDIALSHQEIANMIGATRESISLSLSQLSKENLVRTKRKEIAIAFDRIEKILADS
jgi:CRP/FNR family transcriptional regulator